MTSSVFVLHLALWNGKDAILKERLFGLTNSQGNHGEDVKEYYFYLDSTPTHSYMKYLYKYPQAAYPYGDLIQQNASVRVMTWNMNCSIQVYLMKTVISMSLWNMPRPVPDDILVKITAVNRGPEAAELHVLPTLWFRNDWSSWIAASNRAAAKPNLTQTQAGPGVSALYQPIIHNWVNSYFPAKVIVPLLFTENETNHERLFPGTKNESPYVKDGINDYVVYGNQAAVNPEKREQKPRHITS